MSGRSTSREVRVGLVVVVAGAAMLGLFKLAGGGPGFLSASRNIDVIFKDGQGIRVGSPVRIAGLDAGRVVDVDLTEVDGALHAKVRLAMPVELASRLRQDVKIAVQSSLSGQSRINVVSSGRSSVALVPGQSIRGVETSMFDPVLEQVGLGPVERGHLSHTIAEIRQTVDAAGPRVKLLLGALQESAAGLKEVSDAVRPNVEATAGHVEDLTRRMNASAPKIEAAITRLDNLSVQLDGILVENRPNILGTIAGANDLVATLNDVAAKDRVKVEKLLVGLEQTRTRADRVLYQADIIATQGASMVAANKADVERTVANVRDATDWADKLVQKLYANPFVLSPLYKPTPEDTRIQAVYDTAQVFSKGARELHDAVKSLEALQGTAKTPEQQQSLAKLYERAWALTSQLGLTSQQLAEGLKGRGKR